MTNDAPFTPPGRDQHGHMTQASLPQADLSQTGVAQADLSQTSLSQAGLPHVSSAPASRAIEGILFVVFGMMFFVVQDIMMKFMLGAYPVWVLIFARAVMAVLILVPLIVVRGPPNRLLTPLWPWHLARAVLFTSGFTLFYTALPLMGLAEATTIFFAAPLFTALLAAVWLKETIGRHRLAALGVGFIGVVIAINPAGDSFTWVSVLPLICALTYAASQIIVRRIGDDEGILTIGLYTIAISGIIILPLGWLLNQMIHMGPDFQHLRWGLPPLGWQSIGMMALLGTVGMIGYTMLSRAYQVANASLVAPFDYSYLPMATVVAWLVFGEQPHLTTYCGMALIIASGLYLGIREVRASRKSNEPPAMAESSFAPGNPVAPVALAADIDGPDERTP